MNPANALRYFSKSLTALLRRRSLRSRALLLVLVALINTAQGIACNLHDLSFAAEFSTESVVNVSKDHATDPAAPLDIEAHCLHISCVHSPAFPPSPIAHAFVPALGAVPTAENRLHWPAPPLGVHFRPPITA